ncbi:MAG: hypothetical protein JOZ14_00950, partial [Acidobacteria bacterium]|nr:hypothetical protein [Acidobacteriota bacterium]
MKSFAKLCLLSPVCFTWLLLGQASKRPADLVVINGRVYMPDSRQLTAQAIAVSGDRILAIGSEREIARKRGPSTRVIDAKGRPVLPGFTDCHVHFLDAS